MGIEAGIPAPIGMGADVSIITGAGVEFATVGSVVGVKLNSG